MLNALFQALDDVQFSFGECMLNESWRARVLQNISSTVMVSNDCSGVFSDLLQDTCLWEIPYRDLGEAYDREWLLLVNDWKEQVFARSKPYWNIELSDEEPKAVQVINHLFAFDEVWVGPRVDTDVFYVEQDMELFEACRTQLLWHDNVIKRLYKEPMACIETKNVQDAFRYLLSIYHLWGIPCTKANHIWYKKIRMWQKDTWERSKEYWDGFESYKVREEDPYSVRVVRYFFQYKKLW